MNQIKLITGPGRIGIGPEPPTGAREIFGNCLGRCQDATPASQQKHNR